MHSVQLLAGFFHRHDRVFKRRWFRVISDRLDFIVVFFHCDVKRIETVYQSEDQKSKLDHAQQRLLTDRYRSFVRSGAKLNADQKKQLTEINQKLAGLFVAFSQNVLHDEANYETWISDEKDLAGLSESVITAMATACEERADKAPEGAKWCVTNTRSSMDPFLTKADNRELRKEVWTKYYNRGDNGDEHDNLSLIHI